MTTQTEPHLDSNDAVAERVVFLRERVTPNQREFAKELQVEHTTWNNYETGVSRISLEAAKKLARRYKASLDWIYLGVEGLMPEYLLQEWRNRQSSKRA